MCPQYERELCTLTDFVSTFALTVLIPCKLLSCYRQISLSEPPKPSGMNHIEGSWPKSVECSASPEAQLYRDAMLSSATYKREVVECALVADYYMNDNNTIDIYEDAFEGTCSTYLYPI